MSKCHIVVGATGTGKTTYVKDNLSKVPNKDSIIVYDVNNEYSEFYDYEFIDYKTFLKNLTTVKNSVVVLEESTIFLGVRGDIEDIRNILVRKRHTKNYIFLCFHSLRSVPRYIYDMADYITVFKTNDTEKRVSQTFEDDRLTDIVRECKESDNKHIYKFLQIY